MKYFSIDSTRVGRVLPLSGITALAVMFACSTSDPGGSGSGSGGVPGAGGDIPGGVGGNGPSGSGGAAPSGGAGGAGSGGAPGAGGGPPSGSGGVNGSGGAGATHAPGIVPGTTHYNCDPPAGEIPELQLTPIVETGLEYPIYLTHAPDETERLFVLEQAGRIRILRNGVLDPDPFLDIVSQVSIDPWEQGLLGLAFHPDYASNRIFYVHFTAQNVSGHPNRANVVAEYKVSESDPDVADPTSQRILFSVATDNAFPGYHNGGSIFFGVDSELFIGIGDGAGRGPSDTPSNNGQNLNTLRGKLLRINPLASGSDPYTIPTGNLAGGLPEIWDYGLRNPYRVNIDACHGDIYIGDVGHFEREEVNVEKREGGKHNYGWPVYEGASCYNAGCATPAAYRAPFHDYAHNSADLGAVIGGSVYRGSLIPGLRGTYFFSDLYIGTRTFTYNRENDTISPIVNVEEETNADQQPQTIVAIQSGGDGELYFLGRGGSLDPNRPEIGQGLTRIYRLEPYVP